MLNHLLEYGRQAGLEAEPGYKSGYVRWLLRFDAQGRYLGVMPLGEEKGKGDLFYLPRFSQPELVSTGNGARHFLCDTADVVLLFGTDAQNPPDDKLAANHDFFVNLLCQAGGALPVLERIAGSLRDEPIRQRICADLAEQDYSARPSDNVTFAVDEMEPPILVRSDAWRPWYAAVRAKLKKSSSAGRLLSLASGELVAPALTHPKITGLGGQPSGDVFTSFDKDAFLHYGLKASENAAVSEDEAAGYAEALNSLIRERSRRLAGSKIVYWYAGDGNTSLAPEEDIIELELLPMAAAEEDDETAEEIPPLSGAEQAVLRGQAEAQATGGVRRLLEAIKNGQRPDLVRTRFYAMSLAANSGRVVLRDWMDGQFTDLAASILTWMNDLSVVRLDSPSVPERVSKLESLITCVLPRRPKGQQYKDWIKSAQKYREPLWRAAIGARPGSNIPPPAIPVEVINAMLPRWRASILNGEFGEAVQGSGVLRGILYARVSLFKAFLIRKGDQMEPCLFEDHESPAYQCGRLLAVLADIQRTALGDVGAGVVQRYYARASTAPADAIGPLIRLSNAHLNKISDKRLASYLQDRIAGIFSRISLRQLPETLDAAGQSLFALGYYQQVAHMRHQMLAKGKMKSSSITQSGDTAGEGDAHV